MPSSPPSAAWYLHRLPLDPERLGLVIRQGVAQVGLNPLRIAHALGDMRWMAVNRVAQAGRSENGTILTSFVVDLGDDPAVYGYSRHPLDVLAGIPIPADWQADPIDWAQAGSSLLLPLLTRDAAQGAGIIPLIGTVAPVARITLNGPGERRKIAEFDLRDMRQGRPTETEAEILGPWLARRWQEPGSESGMLRAESCRILAHAGRIRIKPGAPPMSPTMVGIDLCAGSPEATMARLVRGIGRYKSFGLGFMYNAGWLP